MSTVNTKVHGFTVRDQHLARCNILPGVGGSVDSTPGRIWPEAVILSEGGGAGRSGQTPGGKSPSIVKCVHVSVLGREGIQ